MKVWPFYKTVSRLNYKPDVFNHSLICKPVKDLLLIPNHNKTFEELCLERATSIKQLDGPIYVMWSGGIDSTAVMTSIFRTFSKQELERVTVFCDDRSFKENPNYFRLIVKNKIKIMPSTLYLEPYLENGWVITGELGDQIFGHDIVGLSANLYGEDTIQDSWEKHLPKLFESISPGGSNYINEILRPIIDEAPFKITSVHDFGWWYNFSQKWQHVQLRWLICNTWKDPKKSYSKLIHFYDCTDFEIWSLYNQHLKIGNTMESYKGISKQFSIDWSGDQNFMNKRKETSLIHMFLGHSTNWAVDEEWNFLTKEQAFERLI
jgi:hypothetical protein